MADQSIAVAALLGLLEGLTEFIPVSSTGHLLLAGHFLGLRKSTGKTFEVVIQLGAILAILSVYCGEAVRVFARDLRRDPVARRFVVRVLLAFLPAAAFGRSWRTTSSRRCCSRRRALIAAMLILGGIVLIWVDRRVEAPRYEDAMHFPMRARVSHRAVPVPRAGAGRVALGRDHRRGAADGREPARGGGVLVLPVDADDGGGGGVRPVPEPRRAELRGRGRDRGRVRRGVRSGAVRGAPAARIRVAARLRACSAGGESASARRRCWGCG